MSDDLEIELDPPSPEVVAGRATLAFALAMRGLLEADAGREDEVEAEMIRSQMVEGLRRESRLVDVMVEGEMEALETPIGGLDPEDADEMIWWSEQGQVLLWALERRDLPAHDAQEHPFAVAKSTGVISNVGGIPTNWLLLRSPRVRGLDQVLAVEGALALIFERLEQHEKDPTSAVDFVSSLTGLGEIPIEIATVDGDLSIEGVPVTRASAEAVGVATEVAAQRLCAAGWLLG